MLQSDWIGEEKHDIRVDEIGSSGHATFHSLLRLMQEVAWNNSRDLNYSVYDMMKHGVTWVVYRMQFRIYGYPRHYDEVTVRSWPSGRDRLYTYRDYQLMNSDGKELIRGTSAWLVFNIERRRPVPIPDFFKALEFPEDIPRMELDKPDIEIAETPSREIEVQFSHTDVNMHTNNNHYFQWILDDLSRSLGKMAEPNYIDIIFKGESHQGDHLQSFMDLQEDGNSVHRIYNEEGKGDILLASVKW